MYIYELPFEINKELCRLLDNDDDWKELAGNYMKYSPFEVNEIEQTAHRKSLSPTSHLFTCWGQLNHRVEELFILLYHMEHIPALTCLVPVVDSRFHRLLKKRIDRNKTKEILPIDENANNNNVLMKEGSDTSIPLPVMLIEKGVQLPTTSRVTNGTAPTDETSSDTGSKNSSSRQDKTSNSHDEFLRSVAAIPMLSYDALREATNNWSDSNLLGRGGFGQVFKGEWKLLPVAIKRLLRDDDGMNKELIREMCLNQYRHDNILPLYGYSLGGPEACLVYQLMAGGSLEQRLRLKTPHPPLSWTQRYRIVHGVARGLQYLHTMAESPLIHGDIKPANILLDQCTMPKIGDFGLARKGPYGEHNNQMKVSRVHGTRPYLPDDYIHSRCLSPEVDVYSYGVVIIETVTALPALDRKRSVPMLARYLHNFVSGGGDVATLEDETLKRMQQSNPPLARQFVSIGLHCTSSAWQQRPSMLQVYRQLEALDVPGKELI